MKKSKPSFGHVQIDYRLGILFTRAVADFKEADAESNRVEKEYNLKKATSLIPQWHDANIRRVETGVVLLLVAGALIEEMLYSYAVTFLDPTSFEEHLGRNNIVTKFLLLPRLCQQKEIPDDHPAINGLRELIKARNAIAHHKREALAFDLKKPSEKIGKESDRFRQACRNAQSTINALIELLTSPKPVPIGSP